LNVHRPPVFAETRVGFGALLVTVSEISEDYSGNTFSVTEIMP